MNHSSSDIVVLHGPNLNLLGQREPEIYGSLTLTDINAAISEEGKLLGLTVAFFQSNHEGALIDRIHEAIGNSRGLLINPGGLTHTSVSLRDALAAYPHPKIEVHLSNVAKREPFRHHSYISPVVDGVIAGLGHYGYILGVRGVYHLIR